MNSTAVFEDFVKKNDIYYVAAAPMSEYTSFRIGGPADILLEPDSTGQLEKILIFCSKNDVPVFVCGKGSNLLVSDRGIRGAVIHFGSRFSEMHIAGHGTVTCSSGASLAQLCRFARDSSLTGLEFAYGIPGSVGGAVYMNAGAYGGEIKNICMKARYIDKDGMRGEFSGNALDFSYRHSVFSGGCKYITEAVFSLSDGNSKDINTKMEELLNRRLEKQPMDMPSAGSAFKRPKGAYASALIDQCGLKGFSVGGAQISTKHAGFVVNTGGATCSDVLALMDAVRERVFRETGFVLEKEIELAGQM